MQIIERLRQKLAKQIIPSLESAEAPRIILARRPLHLPPNIKITYRPAPILQVRREVSNLFLGRYPEEGMHAIRYPYLCYVMEGKIDIRLGIPTVRGTVQRYEILTLPAETALLIPPGVFYPDAKSTYWEHSGPQEDVHVFWIHILPTGIFCHTGAAQRGIYAIEHHDMFVPGQHFATLIDIFEEDLHFGDRDAIITAKYTLLSFFRRVFWKMKQGSRALTSLDLREYGTENTLRNDNSLILRRACAFIDKHNNATLTVEEVAAHAYVSPSHLMRLFRTELHTTVINYALKKRLGTAETWLKNSEMPIKQIANILGYSQTPQFNRIFKQIYGMSPTEFRRQQHK